MANDDAKNDTIVDRIRKLVEIELTCLEQMTIGLGEDGLKRLTACALIMQRIRQSFTATPTDPNGNPLTNEKLMKAAGGSIDE